MLPAMCWNRSVVVVSAVAAFCIAAAPVGGAPAAPRCEPTRQDAFGPFERGSPPRRARIGTGHVLTGVVLSAHDCRPIAGATVELWQANKAGRYTRAGSGTVVTTRAGRFRFEGPYPPSYEGRPPHIHLRVSAPSHETLLARYVPPRGSRRGSVRLVLVPEPL
jgi:protocatechuate 3,4-dioxygenase beta subunit